MKSSDSLAIAARSRIVKASEQRKRALKAISEGRPLDAEPSEVRKVHRFQAVAGVGSEQARKLCNYKSAALVGLEGEKRLGAERIQGRSIDFVGVSFLELARAAASTVGRVISQDLKPLGSGFMVSERLFLTNNHVIPSKENAKECFVEFNYEMDIDGHPKAITRFALEPDEFFINNPTEELDFALVAIGSRVSGAADKQNFGYCPLISSDDKHVLGEFVNIIQHPEGDFKQIVLRENQLVNRLDRFLEYMADTNPGSSGSPVFNDQWEVIALHHWGEPTQLTTDDGKPIRKDLNEGVRISSIFNELQSRRSTLTGDKRALLDAALKSGSRHPSTLEKKSFPSSQMEELRHDPISTSFKQDYLRSDGTVSWRIPIDVSIRLGDVIQPKDKQITESVISTSKEIAAASAEAIQIDRNYSNRSGYIPRFLSGHDIPLPSLSKVQKRSAARKLHYNDDEDPYELKYQHFSIIMNANRRIAFFTAVNIDGSKWITVDRGTGEPSELLEAAENWYEDPRIESTTQSDQSMYDSQRPKRILDRGHLVRRQDPSWGTPSGAKKANADTFHFTNCSPQHFIFNQRVKYWAGIENYVLDNAKAENERVSVFTGPVLSEDDPDYRNIKVPTQFWKILVRVEQGNILATGLLADQSELITQLPEGLGESFVDVSKVKEYQTSIRTIEKLTGLDFGSLRDHDTYQQGPESSIETKLKLESFDDIKL